MPTLFIVSTMASRSKRKRLPTLYVAKRTDMTLSINSGNAGLARFPHPRPLSQRARGDSYVARTTFIIKEFAMGKKLKALAGSLTENQLALTVKDSAQQIWLAGLGAFAKAQEAVSYTHLDVYKRQVLPSSATSRRSGNSSARLPPLHWAPGRYSGFFSTRLSST